MDDALEGNLGSVTDDEWFSAHDKTADLFDSDGRHAEVDALFTYVFGPGEPIVGELPPGVLPPGPDSSVLTADYDPDTDERLNGGGFRG